MRDMASTYLLKKGYSVMYGSRNLAVDARLAVLHRLAMCDGTDADLTKAQTELSLEFAEYPRRFVELNLDRFIDLLGPDLMIQKYPYLRIARPGKAQDNIGYHRDTLYGSSPHELSVLIALTDMVGGAALKVLPGSHLKPEGAYPYTEGAPQCEKGSSKHALGFLYAPKVFGDDVREQMVPVDVRAGDMLVFFPSLIHGQEVNTSEEIRTSFDLRLCNAYAPIKKARNVHEDYYQPLCESVTTKVAQSYAAA